MDEQEKERLAEERKQKILNHVVTCKHPTNTECIRKAVGEPSWNLILAICLELMLERKLKGLRTHSGWVFWVDTSEPPNPFDPEKIVA